MVGQQVDYYLGYLLEALKAYNIRSLNIEYDNCFARF